MESLPGHAHASIQYTYIARINTYGYIYICVCVRVCIYLHGHEENGCKPPGAIRTTQWWLTPGIFLEVYHLNFFLCIFIIVMILMPVGLLITVFPQAVWPH